MMETVSIRINDVRQLDTFKKILNEDRSGVIRELVEEGRTFKAIKLYKDGKVSLGLGARLAGITLSEFIDVLKDYNITLNIELEDVKLALEHTARIL